MVLPAENFLKNVLEVKVHGGEVQNALRTLDPDGAIALLNDCGFSIDESCAPAILTVDEISEKHGDLLRLMYRGS